jgi:16S rRNA (adenine1518-N6/adenine1519-N6)-dimethyltransferase
LNLSLQNKKEPLSGALLNHFVIGFPVISLHLSDLSQQRMINVRAKKGLGQHFLTDKNIARKIVASLTPDDYGTVLEVGPGMGVLTEYLLANEKMNLLAVELDGESIAYLTEKFPGASDRFIHADFLKFSLEEIKSPIAMIGNFPYFISSQILFRVLENREKISQVVCMIQKEVAERIAAPPGSKTYGILSVLLQAYYEIEYLFTVNEKCFSPPPKVKSAVIRLKRNSIPELSCNPELFFRVVKTGFNQRRKVLRNSLQPLSLRLPLTSELLIKRPEQLSVNQFEELARQIENLNQD